MEALPYVDFLFGNENEATTFAESENWDTKDIAEIALKVSELSLPWQPIITAWPTALCLAGCPAADCPPGCGCHHTWGCGLDGPTSSV